MGTIAKALGFYSSSLFFLNRLNESQILKLVKSKEIGGFCQEEVGKGLRQC